MKKVTLLFLAFVFLLSCSSPTEKFSRVSYFKNENNFRVFVYLAADGVGCDEMKTHAEKQMYTAGATTAVYYYYANQADSIKYDITTAPDAFEAQTQACQKGCAAGYWKFPTGKVNFIEKPCEE